MMLFLTLLELLVSAAAAPNLGRSMASGSTLGSRGVSSFGSLFSSSNLGNPYYSRGSFFNVRVSPYDAACLLIDYQKTAYILARCAKQENTTKEDMLQLLDIAAEEHDTDTQKILSKQELPQVTKIIQCVVQQNKTIPFEIQEEIEMFSFLIAGEGEKIKKCRNQFNNECHIISDPLKYMKCVIRKCKDYDDEVVYNNIDEPAEERFNPDQSVWRWDGRSGLRDISSYVNPFPNPSDQGPKLSNMCELSDYQMTSYAFARCAKTKNGTATDFNDLLETNEDTKLKESKLKDIIDCTIGEGDKRQRRIRTERAFRLFLKHSGQIEQMRNCTHQFKEKCEVINDVLDYVKCIMRKCEDYEDEMKFSFNDNDDNEEDDTGASNPDEDEKDDTGASNPNEDEKDDTGASNPDEDGKDDNGSNSNTNENSEEENADDTEEGVNEK